MQKFSTALNRAPTFFYNANPARRKIKEPIFLWAGLLCFAASRRLSE
ncbi:MAG: hypothetical protein LBP75_03915 [Planctomycetota bacterium]|nr:hypothetical protein [Planctomycetota bacterium]